MFFIELECGDEEEIGEVPAAGFFGFALFDDEGIEDSAQEDNGKVGLVELNEEDAKRLARRVGQWTELEDFAVGKFLRLLRFETELVSIVFKGEFVVFGNWPVKLIAEVVEDLVKVHLAWVNTLKFGRWEGD